MELIQPVAIQPTLVGKLQTLWDFTVVKLAVVAGVLGAIGLAQPVGQHLFGSDFMAWMPLWFTHTCQSCGLLVTLGIVPSRGVAQPNVSAKAVARATANTATSENP